MHLHKLKTQNVGFFRLYRHKFFSPVTFKLASLAQMSKQWRKKEIIFQGNL